MTGAKLQSLAEINRFAFGGNARLTLVSKRTGERRTFRIREAKNNPTLFFVQLMNGPDNETAFQYLGTVRDGHYEHGRKSKITRDAPAAKAFSWFMAKNEAGEEARLLEQCECWHEGRCGRCGRALTVPESIATGIGPECSKKVPIGHRQSELPICEEVV